MNDTITSQPLQASAALIPVRILNEYVYCPRLAHMMWVQGEFAHNADTVEGRIRHKRVDQEKGRMPDGAGNRNPNPCQLSVAEFRTAGHHRQDRPGGGGRNNSSPGGL